MRHFIEEPEKMRDFFDKIDSIRSKYDSKQWAEHNAKHIILDAFFNLFGSEILVNRIVEINRNERLRRDEQERTMIRGLWGSLDLIANRHDTTDKSKVAYLRAVYPTGKIDLGCNDTFEKIFKQLLHEIDFDAIDGEWITNNNLNEYIEVLKKQK